MSGYGMDLPKSTNVNTNYTPAKAGKSGKAAEANTVKQPLLSFETKRTWQRFIRCCRYN